MQLRPPFTAHAAATGGTGDAQRVHLVLDHLRELGVIADSRDVHADLWRVGARPRRRSSEDGGHANQIDSDATPRQVGKAHPQNSRCGFRPAEGIAPSIANLDIGYGPLAFYEAGNLQMRRMADDAGTADADAVRRHLLHSYAGQIQDAVRSDVSGRVV